jgi:hypothetical protein
VRLLTDGGWQVLLLCTFWLVLALLTLNRLLHPAVEGDRWPLLATVAASSGAHHC